MKSFTRTALSVLVISTLLSCGSSDSNNNNQDTTAQQQPSATVAATPLPVDIEKKFGKIIDEYQKKISTGFSGTFQADTRHGGKGPEEGVFDADKFDAYMTKKGFSKIPNTMLNYSGEVDEVNVTIAEKTTSGEHGGWIHNWTIELQTTTPEGTFNKQHQFSTQPGA